MKRAIVLGGGGSRGAYEIGVFRALTELYYKFHIVTGTSVGAINAALIVQGDVETAIKFWQEVETSKIFDAPISNKDRISHLGSILAEIIKNGGIEYSSLKKIIRENIDEDKIRNSPIDFGVVTIEFPSLKPLLLFKEDIPEGKLNEYIIASAACFPAMKMHEIDGITYIDGGFYDNLPISMAIEKGAKEIIAIDLYAPGKSKIPDSEGVDITVIRSPWPLGDILLFDRDLVKRNMRLGYYDYMKHIGRYDGVRYIFKKGESTKFIQKNYKKFTNYLSIKFNITEGKPRNTIEKIARLNIARALRKKWEKQLNRKTSILAAAEITAEIFEIAPDIVYTFRKFNNQLRRAIELVANDRSNGNLRLKDIINQKHRVLYISDELNKTKGSVNLLTAPGAAALMPLEFIAATYINVMKLR